jgi:phosphate:Na+ symporter
MSSTFDIWKMLAGVAFFLLAMNFMEQALRQLAGRRFKLFLKKQTQHKAKAIAGGAVITGLLQSSSIVNLLVLGMAGAGVVGMENALALMLGSNLGTTLDSWLLALAGFNYNISNFVLPVVAVTGIASAFMNNESRWFQWFRFLFSLAFVFVSLDFIKTGMEGFVKQTDLSQFVNYPIVVFLLLGILLTALVQSSSAVIALTLSALYTDAVTLYMAMAIVLGSEVGTTLKLFLAAAKGDVIKKRVALGNFLFNIITVIMLFFLLAPIHRLITNVIQISNNLLALVFFQTFVNLCSVLLFFPLLPAMSRFLLKRYNDADDESSYISKVPVTDAVLAIGALENEVKHLVNHVIEYSMDSFKLVTPVAVYPSMDKKFLQKTVAEKYEYIKQLHGEMHRFYLRVQNNATSTADTERLENLISSIRNIMYAAKNIRDAQHDIEQVRNSSNDAKYGFYTSSRETIAGFYNRVIALLNENGGKGHFDELKALYQSVTEGYTASLEKLYKEKLASYVDEKEITTLINFNRELYTSFKSLLFGLKDYLLTAREADYFDALPGFIR